MYIYSTQNLSFLPPNNLSKITVKLIFAKLQFFRFKKKNVLPCPTTFVHVFTDNAQSHFKTDAYYSKLHWAHNFVDKTI